METVEQYKSKDLLRFTTAGSVDDGKSTLIGRLLYDSKSIFEDQYEQVRATSERRGVDGVDLSLFTDGLKAEREQGITIDVAYRYFATPKRKFIIADTPGHVQYTRNMVTGASTANLALILIDARNGVVEQTKRHAFIASLLQIPHLCVCINKMDLVDYKQESFEKIRDQFEAFATRLDVEDIRFVPISALNGDNVVNKSENMSWYDGGTLMYLLENIHIGSDHNLIDARFPVQFVIRPNNDEFHDYRGYAGRMAGGILRPGDSVKLLPSGFTSKVKSIMTEKGEISEAYPPMSITVNLEDDLDLSRGDMIVRENNNPEITQDLDLMVCWFNEKPMTERTKYVLLHTSQDARCMVKEIQYKVDINTLSREQEASTLGMNDIGRVKLRSTVPLFIDSYRRNRITGSVIIVDEGTNETVGAGMII